MTKSSRRCLELGSPEVCYPNSKQDNVGEADSHQNHNSTEIQDSAEDFQSFLDALVKSGDRTRSVQYVCIVATLCILASVLNTFAPAWNHARFVKLQHAIICWQEKRSLDDCQQSLEYADRRGFSLLSSANVFVDEKSEIVREIRVRVDDLSKRELEQNSVSLPFFQSVIDVNDTWLLSSLVMTVLVGILAICFERESVSLALTARYATSLLRKEKILASQVFSKPRNPITRCLIIFTPLIVNSYLLYDFYDTIHVGYTLIGKEATTYLLVVFTFLSVILLYVSVRAYRAVSSVDHRIGILSREVALHG